jgi:hypothetical protein
VAHDAEVVDQQESPQQTGHDRRDHQRIEEDGAEDPRAIPERMEEQGDGQAQHELGSHDEPGVDQRPHRGRLELRGTENGPVVPQPDEGLGAGQRVEVVEAVDEQLDQRPGHEGCQEDAGGQHEQRGEPPVVEPASRPPARRRLRALGASR